jgi:hypothetical protein
MEYLIDTILVAIETVLAFLFFFTDVFDTEILGIIAFGILGIGLVIIEERIKNRDY